MAVCVLNYEEPLHDGPGVNCGPLATAGMVLVQGLLEIKDTHFP